MNKHIILLVLLLVALLAVALAWYWFRPPVDDPDAAGASESLYLAAQFIRNATA